MTMKNLMTVAVLSSVISAPVLAAEPASKPLVHKSDVAIGAGIVRNSIDLPAIFGGDQDETGFQFFVGFDLRKVNLMDGVNTSVEVGYMDYGFDGGNSGGLWATAVVDGDISGSLNWLGRLGFDFGDDDGIMFGAGLGLELNTKTEMRFEYVIRDEIDSLQFNLYYHL